MEQHKLDRINFLARKKKTEGLSETEAAEHTALREEYLAEFRASFGGILENTYLRRPDGRMEKLRRKQEKEGS